MLKVTTRISRDEMRIAKQADPREHGVSQSKRRQGQAMIGSIIARMENLVKKITKFAFIRYRHATDRAMDIEDLLATVNGELVLAIYRFDTGGKYEPLNYLLGVVHVVLKNVHNHRNRKKRTPMRMVMVSRPDPNTGEMIISREYVGGVVSMNASFLSRGKHGQDHGMVSYRPTTIEDELKERLSMDSPETALVSRMEVESLFEGVKGITEVVIFREDGQEVRRIVSCQKMVRMLLEGETISSMSRELHIPRHIARAIMRNRIIPALAA